MPKSSQCSELFVRRKMLANTYSLEPRPPEEKKRVGAASASWWYNSLVKVWLICVAIKSSNRVFAPDATVDGVRAGSDIRHCTALM